MKKRWIMSAVAVVGLLGATAGIAYAAGTRSTDISTPGSPRLMGASEATHDTRTMSAMHERMPAAMQDVCEAMHEQMDQMMMNGSGMLEDGEEPAADHASHHPG